MPTYATPGVYFESADQAGQAVSALRTDIAAFVGIAAQGPLRQAVAVTSWNQFQSTFGSFIPTAYLAYCAKAFFENGGEKLYAVRVAAPRATTTTNPSPLVVQPPNGSSSLVVNTAGFAPGALVTVSQNALTSAAGVQPPDGRSSIVQSVAGFPQGVCVLVSNGSGLQEWHKVVAVDASAKRLYWDSPLNPLFLGAPMQLQSAQQMDCLLLAVDSGTNTLTWASPLTSAFDPSQPIQFATGAGRAEGIFYDGGANPTLRVRASSPGTWGDALAVGVAPSSLAATVTSTQAQPASGAYSYVQSITGFPPGSLVKVYQSGTIDYRTVTLVDASTGALTWDTPLVPPKFDVTKPISFETVEFSLTVYVSGRPLEIFPGLSLARNHPRYVESVINPQTSNISSNANKAGLPSQYIRVTNLVSNSAPPNNLPNPASPQLTGGGLNLQGGRDGLAALQPNDFTGDPGSSHKWGLRLLEDVDEVSIVAVPDILIEPAPLTVYAPVPPSPRNPCLPGPTLPVTAPPPPPPPREAPPSFSLEEVAWVQQALIDHCELMQFRFAILDPPDFGYPNQQIGLAEIQSWRNRFDTEYAALYFPWTLVVDPLQLGNEVVRRIPPSGHVAGVYANTDLTVGVFKAPANTALQWAQDLTTEVTSEMQSFLNPIGVDCLRVFPGRGLRVYGARTVSSQTSWQFVNVRRLISMIEHALLIALQWAVFEPNDYSLWSTVTASVTNFLNALWKQGAFVGNTPAEAFYVTCNATNNPVTLTEEGQLNIEIGVAPTLPAEFVVFRIGVTQDVLEVTE